MDESEAYADDDPNEDTDDCIVSVVYPDILYVFTEDVDKLPILVYDIVPTCDPESITVLVTIPVV